MPSGRLRVVVPLLGLLLAGCTAGGAGTTQPGPPIDPSSEAAAAGLARTPVLTPGDTGGAPFGTERFLNVPEGWRASVYARIPRARFMAVLPDGGVLVSQPDRGVIHLVRPGGEGGSGRVSEWVGGLDRGHDIVVAEVGGLQWIYVSEADKVVRYPYVADADRAGEAEVVVDNLPDESLPELGGKYGHVLKNIALDGDTLYVSIASTCNACASDTTSDPIRGAVYRYDASGRNANRALVARGLRNAEGLAIAPGTHDLWVVVNNRDNILVPDDRDVDGDGRGDKGERDTAYVDDHPPEEFVKVRQGGFYGWPFCNPNIDEGMRNMPYDRDYELNADGSAADCASATPVDVGIQAHSAPLGLTFTPLGASIALHGSWNRSRPTGYKVINFPWTSGTPGDQQDLVSGFLEPGAREPWGRPVDVAVTAGGEYLVSDDKAGAVYLLDPTP